MSTVNFSSDNSVQGTITTITSTPLSINLYAYNTSLSNLSTNSILSINNLNNTSTTIFNNLNSLSTNSILNINNLNNTSTTIFNNLNSFSTNSRLLINNLNNTSTTIFNNLNSLSTNSILSINNLNNTSTTIFNNLNSLSTNSILNINNLNNTSTTIFNNLNSLSTNSILSINNLNTTSTTIFNNLNSFSTNSRLLINNLNATSTSIFNNLNSLSTNSTLSINNLNNKTNFTNLIVSNSSTLLSTLNIVGNIIGSGTALSNLNYNAILNPPTLVSFNNPSTFISTLNISGRTTLNNSATCISSLNISGVTTFSNKVGINTTATNCNLEILGLANIHNGTRYAALNYNLNAGSLILGSTALNYGGGTNWNGGNAAGLMMECLDNTEIVVHDNGNRLASLMYYEGGATNRLTLGRNMGWDTLSGVVLNGNVTCTSKLTLKGELENQYWKFTNDSDYCRLNGVGGGYFNFAANNLYSSGIIYASGDKLNFLDTLNQYKINLWGANTYGFGIASETLQYSSYNYHRFYNSTNNLNTFSIDGTGNITCVGILNVSSSTTLNNAITAISSLNVSGLTTLSNNTTCLSTLNVSGSTTLSGGTITGKILMNGTVVNDYSLQIKNNNYTCPVLCIDSGLSSSAGFPNTNARAIGMPLLGIGAASFNDVGDYYAIGLGYCSLPTRKYCCEVGVVITNKAGGECGDLVFSLRNTTVSTDIAVERMRITSTGNVGIGKTPTVPLDVLGNISCSGNIDCGGGIAINGSNAFYNIPSVDAGNYSNTYLTFRPSITNNDWCYIRQIGSDNAFKLAFDFHDDGNDARFCIRNVQSTNNPDTISEVFTVDNGNVSCTGSITANSGQSTIKNYLYIYNPDGRITHLPFSGNNQNYIRGKLNIDQDDLYVGGSTTISGRTYCNGGLNIAVNSWVYDTNGSQRIYFGSGAKTYYQGYGQYTTDINHEWWNHSSTPIMKLSNTGSLLLEGEIIPRMTSIGTNGTDCCGVSFNSSQGTTYQTSIKIIYGTFTGFHRCFTDDIEFKDEEPQKFKDDYVGRIVVSTGKIATDSKTENNTEWNILYDKEGITIEDALPIIQLSRTKKDKRVFGVLGMPTRQNSRKERMIVNSVGEGAIWVCNSNGNIENGDYITSSDYLGYGEKQDDDLLHNYTVAKATIDCNFELDSPYYNCLELDNNIKIAFIACTYHCG